MSKSKAAAVGIFIVAGILLFALGLFLVGNHNELFGHHFVVYTEFKSIDTLQGGAKLRVSGMDAGEVSAIAVPKDPADKFHLTLSVDQKFRNIIRQDSITSIETEGMVGSKYVNIASGTANSPGCDHCTLPGEQPVELGNLLKQGQVLAGDLKAAITDLHQRADKAMDNVTDATGHADQMIKSVSANVEKIAANGAHITGGVDQLVSKTREGEGAAGKILSDQATANNLATAIADAKDATANFKEASGNANAIVSQLRQENLPVEARQTLTNARDATAEVKNAVGSFLSSGPQIQSTATKIHETVDQASRAAGNLASDTEAIKHNFFLRGFFHRRGYFNLTHLNPAEYAKSDFVKHARERIWLPASNMFETSPGGAQQLSDEGRKEIDRAMSRLVDHLPNNPIMIEGYAESGTPAQRYLSSQQRAAGIEQYLESHFHLKPNLVGTIALGDKPPHGTGKEAFDGVCLALVASH